MPLSVPESLPSQTKRFLLDFVEASTRSLGDSLVSIVLFGSAAEGRLRATSDVNVLLLLKTFDPTRLAALRPTLTAAEAAIQLQVMFLLDQELPVAGELFAMKFSDIAKRHLVLFGADPFTTLKIPREAELTRLRQALLNMALRLRQTLASEGNREERLAIALAEATGPLRVAAQTLLELEGKPPGSPKEALASLAAQFNAPPELPQTLSTVRESGQLAPGVAPTTFVALMGLVDALRARAEAL